ncbi:MAG: ABC transporter substrate-binding protein [Candidatus Methanomethylophilaceae archaeon]
MNANTTKIVAVIVVIVVACAGVGTFMILNKDNGNDINITAALEVYGNANGDYKIDESDITVIQKIIDGEEGYTLEKYPLADAYYDSVVDEKDIEQVRKIIDGGNSDGTQMSVWHINHTTADEKQYVAETKWPVSKVIGNGAANALIIYEMVGIRENIAGINYSASSPPDSIVYSYYNKMPSLGSSTMYLTEDLLTECVENNPGTTAVITADNKGYLDGTKGVSEKYIEETLGLDVIRIEHAAVDPEDYASAILTVGFLFNKNTKAYEAAEWVQNVFDHIESETSKATEKVRVAATSYYSYLSARNSDYADVTVAAGGEYTLWESSKSSIYFMDSGSYTADPEILKPEYQPDVIIALRTSAFLGLAKDGASWYGDESNWNVSTMQSQLKNFNVFECYGSKNVYTISGDIPVVARVLYSAAIMYPDLISMEYADQMHQEFVDKFLGGSYNVSEHRFVLSQSDVESLKVDA